MKRKPKLPMHRKESLGIPTLHGKASSNEIEDLTHLAIKCDDVTDEYKTVAIKTRHREDAPIFAARAEVLSRFGRDGFLIGTDLILERQDNQYAIVDLENEPIFKSKDLGETVNMFCTLETPEGLLYRFGRETDLHVEVDLSGFEK